MPAPPSDHRHLRAALEYAVTMAREGRKFKPPLKSPKGLDKYLKMSHLPSASLGAIRRAIEADEPFRTKIAVGALPELVDPIGTLWLERPTGWEQAIEQLVAEADAQAASAGAANELRRAEKRRAAAETALIRSRAEAALLYERLAESSEVVDGLRSDVATLTDVVDALRTELVDTRLEVRHARDREAAALDKLAKAEAARSTAVAAKGEADDIRDEVLADRALLAAERSELARLASSAATLAQQLGALAEPPAGEPSTMVRRKPLALPGGVLGDSAAAGEYLLKSGASILVDGYNVAKLAWPDLDLVGQRAVLLDAGENLARRFGSDITVIFDGADVIGASADRRRIVRVVYSPVDVIADDVIRDEVRRLPSTRPVVVVTNDRAIVRDVRALGANTMSSDQLVALMR